MISTLRTPTYPSYEGRVIDKTTEPALTWTNNADYPLLFALSIKDLDTGTVSGGTLPSDAVRGATVSANVAGYLTAGHDYACTLTAYGRNPSAAAGSTSPGKYDVLLGTGRLQADSDTNTKVYIDKDITCIRMPTRSSSVLMGGCAIQITNDIYLITAYNSTTGEATISAEPINGTTSSLRITSAGEPYKLISNYVVGTPFTFKARTQPSVTLDHRVNDGLLYITGAYSQSEDVPLQSYRMTATYTLGNNLSTTIEHAQVFGTTIAEYFPISPASSGNMCTIKCEVTTADDDTKTFTLVVPALATDNDITITKTTGTAFSLTGKPTGAVVHIWREERDNPEYSTESQYNRTKFIANTTSAYYNDNTVGHQRTYRYHVAVVETTGESAGTVHYSAYSGQYNVYDRACMLWQMTRLDEHKYHLEDNKYFTFRCDVDSGTVETVTGNAVYKSSAAKPKYIRGSDGYEIGSITAMLGTVTSPEADYSDIRKFIDMMTSDGIFLLKTDYGDVKIVAITDNPARSYGASIEQLGITKVTFAWAEIDDIDTAVITE